MARELKLGIQLTADTKGFVGEVRLAQKEIDRLTNAASDSSQANRDHTAATNSNAKAIANMGAAFAGAGAGAGKYFAVMARGAAIMQAVMQATQAVVGMADSYTELNNRLRLVTDSENNLIAVRQRLFDMSQQTQTSLTANVQLYSQLAIAAQNTGHSQQQLLRVTDILNKQVQIGGNNTAAAAISLTQFAQSLANGQLQGDSFTQAMNNLSGVQAGLVDGFRHLQAAGIIDFNVTKANIRDLVNTGQVSLQLLLDAILASGDSADRDFSRIAQTVSRAWQTMGNAVQSQIGQFDKASGASAGLADGLTFLANNMHMLVAGAKVLSAAVGLHMAAAGWKATAALRAKAAAAAVAHWHLARLATTSRVGAAAMITKAAAARGLTVAYRGLRIAMAGLGGPVGIIALAAFSLYEFVSASRAAKDANVELVESFDDLAQSLLKMTRAQRQKTLTTYEDMLATKKSELLKKQKNVDKAQKEKDTTHYIPGGPTGAQAFPKTKELKDQDDTNLMNAQAARDDVEDEIGPLERKIKLILESLDIVAFFQKYSKKPGAGSAAEAGVNDAFKTAMDKYTPAREKIVQDTAQDIKTLEEVQDTAFLAAARADNNSHPSKKRLDAIDANLEAGEGDAAALTEERITVQGAFDAAVKAYAAGLKDRTIQPRSDEAQKQVARGREAGETIGRAKAAQTEKLAALDAREAAEEARRLKPYTDLIASLRSEEEKLTDTYEQGVAIIKAHTEAGSAQQNAQLAALATKHETALADLKARKEAEAARRANESGLPAIEAKTKSVAELAGQTDVSRRAIERRRKETQYASEIDRTYGTITEENKQKLINLTLAEDELLRQQEIKADLLEQYAPSEEAHIERRQAVNELFAQGALNAREYNQALADIAIAEGTAGFADGFISEFDRMTEASSNAMAGIGSHVASVFGPGGSLQVGIGDAAGRAIAFGESFKQAVGNVARQALAGLISQFVQLGIQMVITNTIGKALGGGAEKKSFTKQSGQALATAQQAGLNAYTATAAIPIFGPGLAPAAAATALAAAIPMAMGVIGTLAGTIGFAKGGIVDRPTFFTAGNVARGVAGEAGPEAIMPLKRLGDGRLGVAAIGGGGGTQVNFAPVINVAVGDSNAGNETGEAIGARVAERLQDMFRGVLSEELRPGGLLNRGDKI